VGQEDLPVATQKTAYILKEMEAIQKCLQDGRKYKAWVKSGKVLEQHPYCIPFLSLRALAGQVRDDDIGEEDVLPEVEDCLKLASDLNIPNLYPPNEYASFLHAVQDNSLAALSIFSRSVEDLLVLLKEALEGKYDCLIDLENMDESEKLLEFAKGIFPEGLG